jgi:transposase
MRRYALRDDQWDRIKDLLPGRPGSVGVTATDNRLFVDAVLYRYRAGIPWRDLPERFGDPVGFHLTGGEAHDLVGADHLLPDMQVEALIADKAFDADKRVIEPLTAAGKAIVIPPKSGRRSPRTYDRDVYKARHLIENFFARLKQFRAIATRYDKTARNFLAAIYLAASVVWLN